MEFFEKVGFRILFEIGYVASTKTAPTQSQIGRERESALGPIRLPEQGSNMKFRKTIAAAVITLTAAGGVVSCSTDDTGINTTGLGLTSVVATSSPTVQPTPRTTTPAATTQAPVASGCQGPTGHLDRRKDLENSLKFVFQGQVYCLNPGDTVWLTMWRGGNTYVVAGPIGLDAQMGTFSQLDIATLSLPAGNTYGVFFRLVTVNNATAPRMEDSLGSQAALDSRLLLPAVRDPLTGAGAAEVQILD